MNVARSFSRSAVCGGVALVLSIPFDVASAADTATLTFPAGLKGQHAEITRAAGGAERFQDCADLPAVWWSCPRLLQVL